MSSTRFEVGTYYLKLLSSVCCCRLRFVIRFFEFIKLIPILFPCTLQGYHERCTYNLLLSIPFSNVVKIKIVYHEWNLCIDYFTNLRFLLPSSEKESSKLLKKRNSLRNYQCLDNYRFIKWKWRTMRIFLNCYTVVPYRF